MYTYRHKKNGSTFTTPCVCDGEDWEEVKAPAPTPKAKKGKSQETADAESADSGGEDS